MPTAEQYDAFAVTFDDAAEDLDAHVGGPCRRSDPAAVLTGPLQRLASTAVSAAAMNTLNAAAALRDLAAEARRRADICREYSMALRAHERAVDSYAVQMDRYETARADWTPDSPLPPPLQPQLGSSPPERPFPWVERS